MKILIIEDSDAKASQVSELLAASLKTAEMERARSFRSGLKALETTTFDLLILDMVIPVRDGETPSDNGGKNVLSEIDDGSCRRPSHIVCLTAYDDVAEAFKREAGRKLVHVVVFAETSLEWREALSNKAQQIEKRIEAADLVPEDYQVDLAVITSSPDVELDAVLDLPGFTGEFHQKDFLHYYSSTWSAVNGKSISVVACAAPAMGMTAASITACKMISRWKPRYLAMTGIAASTKPDLNYGDILIAEAAFDYSSGKIAESENGTRIFIPSPNQIPINAGLQALLQRWKREELKMDAIRDAWVQPLPHSPRMILGLLASGSAVVQSQNLVDDIIEKSRKVVGLDMEAYGVFHAAHLAAAPGPQVLVAKSVSDFADARKNDDWQRYAAFTSARFIFEFFTNETGLKFGP